MITTQTVLDLLTGKGIVDALTAVMAENFEDFAEEQKRYLNTMNTLEEELGNNISPSVQDEMRAIQQQTASDLLFSGLLGLKANLDNFINPIARNFLDVDFEIYLREDTAHRLPEYKHAEQVRDRFYSSLSPEQKDQYENVITYVSHLETVGPKLAHYYGYLLGNEILYRVVPGYHPDAVLTIQYSSMLEKYLGKKVCGDYLLKAAFSRC